MNPKRISLSLASLKAGVLFAILLCSILVARSSWITVDPLFGIAVTIDLIFSIPIIYFLFIRKTSIPRITVVPVFAIGVLTASFLLPVGERQFLDIALVYLIPTVEFCVFIYLAYRIYRTRSAFILKSGDGWDVMERLRSALQREIPSNSFARIVAFELSIFYYPLIRWRPKREENAFTYHRTDGSPTILTLFLFLLAVETLVIHVLLAQWNSTVAWILTAASIYFGLQIVTHLKATFVRPVQITDTMLLLRCGVAGDAAVGFGSITNLQTAAQFVEGGIEHVKLLAIGTLSKPNITLELDRPATLNGYYGFTRKFRSISFYVDEPEVFLETLRGRLNID